MANNSKTAAFVMAKRPPTNTNGDLNIFSLMIPAPKAVLSHCFNGSGFNRYVCYGINGWTGPLARLCLSSVRYSDKVRLWPGNIALPVQFSLVKTSWRWVRCLFRCYVWQNSLSRALFFLFAWCHNCKDTCTISHFDQLSGC